MESDQGESASGQAIEFVSQDAVTLDATSGGIGNYQGFF